MTEYSPLVHVAVPTLGRRPEWLVRCVSSIVQQDYSNLAVTVVGPAGSLKDLGPVVDRAELLSFDEPGAARAINHAWTHRHPGARYVAWLGDDDELLPGAVRATVDALELRPRASAAVGDVDYVRADDSLWYTFYTPRYGPRYLKWGNDYVPQPGSLFRRSSVESVGWLDTELRNAFDLDLFLKLHAVAEIHCVRHRVARYRVHDNAITALKGEYDESEFVRRRMFPSRTADVYSALRPFTRILDRLIWNCIRVAALVPHRGPGANAIQSSMELRE